ncbi:hypothetical protein BDV10DRAFT_163141 [Aspergillus recurvatus]
MPSYRLEQASTGRAGCQNKECKENKIKIAKGELRLGSWVDTERFQSWFWRHWGCVTPKVIANVNDIVGEGDDRDLEMLDGYEDLPVELQEKVAKALEQGHVDDEDWRGDPEMNVRGSSGFRVKASAKTKKAKDADEEEKDDAAEEKKISKKKTSEKKAKKAKGADDEENEDAVMEKKSPNSKTKKRTRLQIGDDNDDAETASPKRPRRTPTGYPKQVPTISSDSEPESDDSASESPKPKPKAAKRGRQAKEAKPAPKHGKKKAAEHSEAEPAAEKPKRGRKKAAA